MAWSRAILAMGLVAALLSPAMSTPSLISMPADADADADLHLNACEPWRVQQIVRDIVKPAVQNDVGIAAGLLRIMFHDCFPQGCDASILLDTERNMLPNTGLRQGAMDLIERIRGQVHGSPGFCGQTVSCADIINLATREAVMHFGVPSYDVPIGRKDSLKPAPEWAVMGLPRPDFNVNQMMEAFGKRGLDKIDLVALSGAHTIGKARCGNFRDRLRDNTDFTRQLAQMCGADDNRMQDLDVTTPNKFDNMYYTNLNKGKGVLVSDVALTRDGQTKDWVTNFDRDQGWFFFQFSKSMQKLAHLPGSNDGEVRGNCFRPNPRQTVDLAASA